MRYSVLAAGVLLLGNTAVASELVVNITIPTLKVAEYHRPYVAVWIEQPNQQFVANLSVWYDQKKRDNGGTKWLKDLRQWWRKSGRELTMPVDGLSGATRAVGEHTLVFKSEAAPLSTLMVGSYQLVVEAAREGGGRELVRVPFQWPIKSVQNTSIDGQEELGTISLQLKP